MENKSPDTDRMRDAIMGLCATAVPAVSSPRALVDRRAFLTTVGRAAGTVAIGKEIIAMTSDEPATQSDTRASSAQSSILAERAKTFESYLSAVRDRDGLIYSDVRADETRPWTNDELSSYDMWDNWKPDVAGSLLYEDSIMATGRYASARILKHLHSRGDERALHDAERAVRALLALSREGDKIEDGFLPKPFGGLAKASQSKNTSNDQYEHALFALWSFRQASPDSPLIPAIESAIVRWTDFFVRNDFSYMFHGYQWVCTDPMDKGDGRPVSVGRHSLGLYLPMCVMSRQITGDPKYDRLIQDRLLPSLRQFLEDPKVGFSGHSNSCNLLGLGAYSCWKNGVIVPEAKQALKICWRIAEKRLSRYDGLEYDYAHAGASDDHPLEPHYLDLPLPADGWKYALWVSNVKTPSSTVTAHLGALLERVDPDRARATAVRRILEHYKRPEDFQVWVDGDGRQTPPEQAWRVNTVRPLYLAAWLQAYYLCALPQHIEGM